MTWDLNTGKYRQTLRRARPYKRLNINWIRELTDALKATLYTLGVIELRL